jgi:hypothetical protein
MAYGPNLLDLYRQSACVIGHTLLPLCRGSLCARHSSGVLFLTMSDLTKQKATVPDGEIMLASKDRSGVHRRGCRLAAKVSSGCA